MKSLLWIVAVVLAAAAGAASSRLLASDPAPAAGPDTAALGRALADLAAGQRDLADRLADLEGRPAVVAPATRVEADALDAAIARWMEEHGAPGAAAAEPEVAAVDDAARAVLERLKEGDYDGGEVAGMWARLREAGLTDEALAWFEGQAELFPGDPDVLTRLGMAYIFKLDDVGAGPEMGVWAARADEAFDRALEADDRHWDARFAKAISLSHWPPFLGKQAEAIEHLEVLREQQTTMPSDPQFAETYVVLGNLYKDAGEFDKAKAVWEEGLALHPDDPDLALQLAALD